MFCRKCGMKNDDRAIFCKECGAKLVVDWSEEEPVDDTETDVFFSLNIRPKVEKWIKRVKTLPKKYMMGAGIGLAVAVVVFAVVAHVKSTVNLNRYVTVSFEGYDGYGNAYVSIDWDKIAQKYGKKLSVGELQSDVSISLEPEYGLSNGDEISYIWYIDEDELEKDVDCNIKYENETVDVSGLKEMKTFDPFADLTVTYSGISPDGSVALSYTGKVLDESEFYCDMESGLQNGDVITVYLKSDDMDYYMENYGMIPSGTQKEYTVEGLDQYAVSTKEINKDMIAAMKKQAKSVVIQYAAKMDADCTVNSITFVGDYLESYKNGYSYDNQNCYGDVYEIKLDVKPSEDYKATRIVMYYDVQFQNIVIKANGVCEVDLSNYATPDDNFSKMCYYGPDDYDYYTYYFDGFETLADVKNARVDRLAADYDTEWNIQGGDSAEVSNHGRLCSYSTERKITKAEIQDYLNKDYSSYHFPGDRSIIQMIINEMYALNGYQFQDEELKMYYEKQDWYDGIESKTTDMAQIYKNMSKIEQDNIKLLKEYQ